LEWRLWGTHAAGYHVVNVLIHAANAVLLWRLLARLGVPGAKLAAAIFALHPVNVESVAWIAELKDTLAMFFMLLTMLFYLRFDDTRLWRWHWISVGTFTLALLSKAAVAPLPLVLLGIAWWRRGRMERKDIFYSAAFFAAAGVEALLTIWFQSHNAIGHQIVRADDFWSRLAIAGRAVWFYLYKALWPVDLIPIYPRWPIGEVNVISFVPGLLLAIVFIVCWLYRATWGRGPLFGLGCFVVMLLPVLGFLNISFFVYSLVADQWQYFAIPAIIVLAAAGITKALARFPVWELIVGAVLLLVLGVLTWRQAALYRDSETLWRAAVARDPKSFSAYNNLGGALLGKGAVDEAISQFQQALKIKPDFAGAYNNLGNAFLEKGNADEAITQFQRALQFNPDIAVVHYNLGEALQQKGKKDEAAAQFQLALQIDPDAMHTYYNPGNVLLKEGRVDEAIAQFQQALKIDPNNAEIYNNLGSALLQQGKLDEAITQFQQALKIEPDMAEAHNNLGNALLQKGAVDEAIAQLQQALKIRPGMPDAHYNLGNALLQQGNAKEAIIQFQKAVEITPGYVEAHNNLGNAFLRNGNVDEAILQFKKALQIEPDSVIIHNNLGNAFIQKTNFDEAIFQFQKAVEINPGYTKARYNLAMALVQKGKTNEAILQLQEAISSAQAAGRPDMIERINAALKSLGAAPTAQ